MPEDYLLLLQGRKGDTSAAMSTAGLCVAIYDAFAEAASHNMLPRGFVCLTAGWFDSINMCTSRAFIS